MLAATLAVPMFAERPTPEERANLDYTSWLPQQGDWSIGFGIDPIATFVGNLFNGNTNNRLAPLSGETLADKKLGMPRMASIMGSYMLTDKIGLRANIGVGVTSHVDRAYVQDDAAKFFNPYSTLEGKDSYSQLSAGFSASFGAEFRVGHRRVQGVFGVGATYGFWAMNRDRFTYYNAITDANQNPNDAGLSAWAASVDPTAAKLATDYSFIDNPRLLERSTGAGTHIVGVYGSAGVEWFVAPKVALGLNVNLLLDYNWSPSTVSKWEGWNNILRERQEITIHNDAMSNGFTFTTDNIGANLYVAFYISK